MFRTKLMSEPRSQEIFSSFGKAILEEEATADFTIRCETREFKVHKSFLCSRLVQTKPNQQPFKCVPIQVFCAASHDPR